MLSARLYFGDFIGLSLDSYLEFCVAGWLTINAPLLTTDGEAVSFYVGIYSLMVVLFILPTCIAYVNLQNINRLQERKFSEKWSKFYEDLRQDEKPALLYPVIFMARRMIFVLLVFFMYSYPA